MGDSLAQTTLKSGEGNSITIDGTTYTDWQEITYTVGNPRLVQARAGGDLVPVDKEIGLSDDQPIRVAGLVADEVLMSIGGKILTCKILEAAVTVYDADCRWMGPERGKRHNDMDTMTLTGNAQSIRTPVLTHLIT